MTHAEFTDTVRLMRKAQKEYFATRSKEILRVAKRLELLVDSQLRNIEPDKPGPDPKQKELF